MLPGEQVKHSSSLHKTRRLRLGEGLRHASDAVSATCAGILHTDFTGEAWLDVRSKKYVPAEDETVIGTVIEAHADSYVIDISAPSRASLPALSFEGATKHNRPKLTVGSLVHCRVLKVNCGTEAVLTCIDKAGQSGSLGVLLGGYTYECSTHISHHLLTQLADDALNALGEAVSFEIVVGLNGRVWVNAPTVEDSVLVVRAMTGDRE